MIRASVSREGIGSQNIVQKLPHSLRILLRNAVRVTQAFTGVQVHHGRRRFLHVCCHVGAGRVPRPGGWSVWCERRRRRWCFRRDPSSDGRHPRPGCPWRDRYNPRDLRSRGSFLLSAGVINTSRLPFPLCLGVVQMARIDGWDSFQIPLGSCGPQRIRPRRLFREIMLFRAEVRIPFLVV
jgi:hypothetical protein